MYLVNIVSPLGFIAIAILNRGRKLILNYAFFVTAMIIGVVALLDIFNGRTLYFHLAHGLFCSDCSFYLSCMYIYLMLKHCKNDFRVL